MRRVKDTYEFDDGSETPISVIHITGSIEVPRPQFEVEILVRLLDITDGDDDDALPVLCLANQFQDENGMYLSVKESVIPFTSSTFEGMVAGIVPDNMIRAAHRGQRRFRVVVMFVDPDDHDDVYAIGWSSYSHTEKDIGFAEWGEHRIKLERRIAEIGLAAAGADGSFDRAEIDLIREYFRNRFKQEDDGDELKSEVSAQLKATLQELREKSRTPSQVIREAARALRDDPAACRAAFELAVSVVAVDGEVGKGEDRALVAIARDLQLDGDAVREIRERVIRIDMLSDASEETLLGMPPGLSLDEKLAWLSTEYNRWRTRVTHRDPDRAKEAEERLQRLARLRTELQAQP